LRGPVPGPPPEPRWDAPARRTHRRPSVGLRAPGYPARGMEPRNRSSMFHMKQLQQARGVEAARLARTSELYDSDLCVRRGLPMKRAVLYLRVSTTDQTTANQERELREIAEGAGWEVAKVYRDHGISGAKARALSAWLCRARVRKRHSHNS